VVRLGSSSKGEGMELTCRVCVSVVGVREGGLRGRRNSEEKAYSEKYAKGVRGPDGLMKAIVARGGGGPAW
jgi:hypothetical protein